MSAWTKGPWLVSERGFGKKDCITVYAADDELRYIAFCQDFLNFETVTDNLANAHLIAQAPAMYEALEKMVDEFGLTDIDDNLLTGEGQNHFVRVAMEVLAAARGDSHE